MSKFKVGDRVRVIGIDDDFSIGDILIVDEEDEIPFCIRVSDEKREIIEEENLELISSFPEPPFYVDTPTPEIWGLVVQKMLDNGYRWGDGTTQLHTEYLTKNKDNGLAVSLDKEGIGYANMPFYRKYEPEYGHHIPYQEFLGEESVTFRKYSVVEESMQVCAELGSSEKKIITNLSKKTMSILRSIPNRIRKLLSPNLKNFYQLGWVDEDLEPTRDGQAKMLELLWDRKDIQDELGTRAEKNVREIRAVEKKEDDKE